MADQFGIGAGIRGAAQVFLAMARATGRTTNMIKSLKDGDRVICATAREADHIRRLVNVRGVDAEVTVVPVNAPSGMFGRGTPQGRTILDHAWVEQYFTDALDRAARDIDHLEREASGFGAAHRETQDMARAVGCRLPSE